VGERRLDPLGRVFQEVEQRGGRGHTERFAIAVALPCWLNRLERDKSSTRLYAERLVPYETWRELGHTDMVRRVQARKADTYSVPVG
jgi:hypothetical protein